MAPVMQKYELTYERFDPETLEFADARTVFWARNDRAARDRVAGVISTAYNVNCRLWNHHTSCEIPASHYHLELRYLDGEMPVEREMEIAASSQREARNKAHQIINQLLEPERVSAVLWDGEIDVPL